MSQQFIRRLPLPFVAGSAMLLGLAVACVWYTHWLQQRTAEVVARGVAGVRAAGEFESAVREVRTQLKLFRVTGDREYLKEAARLCKEADGWLLEAEGVDTTPEVAALLARTREGHNRFVDKFKSLPQGGAVGGLEVEAEKVLGPAHEFLEVSAQAAERASEENRKIARRVSAGLLLLGVSGALAGLLSGLLLSRAIGRSFIQLSVPVRDVAGRLNGVVGPIQVTAERDPSGLEGSLKAIAAQVESVVGQLHQSQQEVIRSEQLARVGQLAAGMAHELLNPLMSIKLLVEGNVEEARSRGLPTEDMEIVDQQIDRLERSLRRFLDFARPPRLERRLLRLDDVVEQTMALVGPRARGQGVELRFDRAGAPARVEADPAQVQQLLINLFLNALDAMPRGGVLEVTSREAVGGAVELEVRDTGPGLAPEILPRLFEPFASTKETGMGLGLAVSRRIAEGHGGTLSASNGPEGGARFVFRLPGGGEPASARPEGRDDRASAHEPQLVGNR
jgi:two-component system, NtrC family, sensor histidine kinase HydH